MHPACRTSDRARLRARREGDRLVRQQAPRPSTRVRPWYASSVAPLPVSSTHVVYALSPFTNSSASPTRKSKTAARHPAADFPRGRGARRPPRPPRRAAPWIRLTQSASRRGRPTSTHHKTPSARRAAPCRLATAAGARPKSRGGSSEPNNSRKSGAPVPEPTDRPA